MDGEPPDSPDEPKQVTLWTEAVGREACGYVTKPAVLQATGEKKGGRRKVLLEAWVKDSELTEKPKPKTRAATAPKEELEAPVKIKLKTGFWFIRRKDFLELPKRCPTHQTLRERKLLEWREVSLQELVSGELKRSTAAVSHVWVTKKHFDPEGVKLAKIKETLSGPDFQWLQYVWLDFICLPQFWSDDGTHEDLSKEEEEHFDEAVRDCIPNLFMGASVIILWDVETETRFWPSVELIMALKTPTLIGVLPGLDSDDRATFAFLKLFDGEESKIEQHARKLWTNASLGAAMEYLKQDTIAADVPKDKTTVLGVLQTLEGDLARLFRREPTLLNIPRHAMAGLTHVKRVLHLDFTVDVKHINRFLNRRTAIMLAAEQGKGDLLRLILAVPDIEVNAQDTGHGYTALMFASREGQQSSLEILLADIRTNVNAKADNGDTSLAIALHADQLASARRLLAVPQIEVDVKSLRLCIQKDDRDTTAALLKCPLLQINCEIGGGFRALHLAAQQGKPQLVRQILGCPGVDVNAKAAKDYTALHVAVEHGHLEVARELAGAEGIDLTAAACDGDTPLLLAVTRNRLDLTRMFLSIKEMNTNFQSVLALALQQDSELSQLLLNDPDVQISAELAAKFKALVQRVRDIKEELVAGIDFNGKLLRLAVQETASTELLKLVLAAPHMDDVNAMVFFEEGTALQYAAEKGKLEIVETLLAVPGINVNVDKNGWTALHAAAEHGHTKVVRMLLATPGIDTNIRAGFYTPLSIAEQTRHEEIAVLLRGLGGKRWSKSWLTVTS
ncbi:unnamed protein product [Effrenium voratum]|nr:unnamed protein product [Effrenium voratum]